MDKIAEFVMKKRVVCDVEKKTINIPWYKRPIKREAFSSRLGADGKLYVHHCEWSKNIWIGPYKTKKDVDEIIDSYIKESLKAPLDRKTNKNIHSITVEDETKFFTPHEK